jgi:hypothetical protein
MKCFISKHKTNEGHLSRVNLPQHKGGCLRKAVSDSEKIQSKDERRSEGVARNVVSYGGHFRQ